MTDVATLEESLAAVAALELHTAASPPDRPLMDAAFEKFFGRVRSDRMSGLLAAAVAADRFPVTDDQLDRIAEFDAEVQATTVRIEQSLLRIAPALDEAGIAFRVLKGPAFAHVYWPVPSWRPFVDLDLLVQSDDLDRAVAVAENLGAERDLPQLRRGFDRRFAKNVNLSTRTASWEIHRTLIFGPHTFLIDEGDLWDGNTLFTVAERPFEAPRPEVSLVHACMHATLTEAQRLTTLRDVVEIGRNADLHLAVDIARRWRARASVAAAVRAAHHRLRLPESDLSLWAASLAVPDSEWRLLAKVSEARTQPQLAAMTLRYVPGLSAKAAFAAAFLWPDSQNRAARGRRLRDQATRVIDLACRTNRAGA